eukprot:5955260-Amphidinium_carterae.1
MSAACAALLVDVSEEVECLELGRAGALTAAFLTTLGSATVVTMAPAVRGVTPVPCEHPMTSRAMAESSGYEVECVEPNFCNRLN